MSDSRKSVACFYNGVIELSGTLVMLSYVGVAQWSGQHKDADCLTDGGPA